MKNNVVDKGMLHSTYDYEKMIKMQSEEGSEKVVVEKKKTKIKDFPKKNQSKRR